MKSTSFGTGPEAAWATEQNLLEGSHGTRLVERGLPLVRLLLHQLKVCRQFGDLFHIEVNVVISSSSSCGHGRRDHYRWSLIKSGKVTLLRVARCIPVPPRKLLRKYETFLGGLCGGGGMLGSVESVVIVAGKLGERNLRLEHPIGRTCKVSQSVSVSQSICLSVSINVH